MSSRCENYLLIAEKHPPRYELQDDYTLNFPDVSGLCSKCHALCPINHSTGMNASSADLEMSFEMKMPFIDRDNIPHYKQPDGYTLHFPHGCIWLLFQMPLPLLMNRSTPADLEMSSRW